MMLALSSSLATRCSSESKTEIGSDSLLSARALVASNILLVSSEALMLSASWLARAVSSSLRRLLILFLSLLICRLNSVLSFVALLLSCNRS